MNDTTTHRWPSTPGCPANARTWTTPWPHSFRALRDYAEKNGYIVVGEYIDEAESGRVADRPEFRKMLDQAAKPKAPFKEILVWKFFRGSPASASTP